MKSSFEWVIVINFSLNVSVLFISFSPFLCVCVCVRRLVQMRSHFAAQFFLLLNGDRIKQCTILRNQSANQVFALNSKKMIIPRMFCNAHEMCSI